MKIYKVWTDAKNNFDNCVVLPNEIEIMNNIIREKNDYRLWSITEYLLSQDPNR